MLFIAMSLTVGMGIGIFSAYHTKLAVSGLMAMLTLFAVLIRYFLILGAAASGAIESSNPLLVYWMAFNLLPDSVRLSVVLFPMFIIMGRLGAWIYITYIYVEKVETEEEKRARLLSEFGWGDIRKGKLGPQPRHEFSVKSSKRSTSFGKRR